MTNFKQSGFTTVNELNDSDFVPSFTTAENQKITFSDLKSQLEQDIVGTYIYQTIASVQTADLVADVDNPTYIRCEETEYRLYKITNIAAGIDDISLDNGNTATFQEEYSKSGFVLGAGTVTDGAMVLFSGTSGAAITEGAVPTNVGSSIVEAASVGADSYLKVLADDTVALRTIGQIKTDLSLPGDTVSELALKAPIDSPLFTGNPRVPTAADGDNDTTAANTAFVQGAVSDRVKTVDTFADLATTPAVVGQKVCTLGHTTVGIGGLEFIAKSGTQISNGGTISPSSTASVYWEAVENQLISPHAFGAGLGGNDTSLFEAWIDSGSANHIFAGDYNIDFVDIPANTHITTDGLSVNIHQRTGNVGTRIIYVRGSNVSIGDIHFYGNIATDTNEQNHCLYVQANTTNGNLNNIKLGNYIGTDIRGDVLYLGQANTGEKLTDVTFGNIIVDNVLRNGVSIVSCDGVIRGGTISGTEIGFCHIDVEPNVGSGKSTDIKIDAVKGRFLGLVSPTAADYIDNVSFGVVHLSPDNASQSTPSYAPGVATTDGLLLRNVRSASFDSLRIHGFTGSGISVIYNIGEIGVQRLSIDELYLADCDAVTYFEAAGAERIDIGNCEYVVNDSATQEFILGSSSSPYGTILNVQHLKGNAPIGRYCQMNIAESEVTYANDRYCVASLPRGNSFQNVNWTVGRISGNNLAGSTITFSSGYIEWTGSLDYSSATLGTDYHVIEENINKRNAAVTTHIPFAVDKKYTYTGSKTHDWASIAAGAAATTTVTVTGAAVGDYAEWSMSIALGGLVPFNAFVSAGNTVTVGLYNPTGAPIDLASGTIYAKTLTR